MRFVVSFILLFFVCPSMAYLALEDTSLEEKVFRADYIGVIIPKDEYFERTRLPGPNKLLPPDVEVEEVENIYGVSPEKIYIKDLVTSARANCCERRKKYLVFLRAYREDMFVPVSTADAVFMVRQSHVLKYSEQGAKKRSVKLGELKERIEAILKSKSEAGSIDEELGVTISLVPSGD